MQAKFNALGGPGQPALDDIPVLQSFVDNYDLTVKIATAWTSLLNEEEILFLMSNIEDCHSPNVTDTAIWLASQTLLIAFAYCTKRDLDGYIIP